MQKPKVTPSKPTPPTWRESSIRVELARFVRELAARYNVSEASVRALLNA